MLDRFFKNMMLFDANDGAGSGGGDNSGDGGGGNNSNNNSTNNDGGSSGNNSKTFTQEDIDRVLKDRLARERKAWDKEQADAKKQAEMSEAEKLKAAKDEAEAKATEAMSKADAKIIKAEAKVQALAAGVKPERVDALLKLADISSVTIGDDGEPDAKTLKAAVEAALKEYPEFKAGAGTSGRSGDDFSGGTNTDGLTVEKILEMSPAEMAKNMPAIEAFYKRKR